MRRLISIYSSVVPRGLLERALVQLDGKGLDADVVDVVRLRGVSDSMCVSFDDGRSGEIHPTIATHMH